MSRKRRLKRMRNQSVKGRRSRRPSVRSALFRQSSFWYVCLLFCASLWSCQSKEAPRKRAKQASVRMPKSDKLEVAKPVTNRKVAVKRLLRKSGAIPPPAPSDDSPREPRARSALPSVMSPEPEVAAKEAGPAANGLYGTRGANLAKNKALGGKKGSKEKEKPKAQVWKRTEKGTVLSKVSVGGKKFLLLKKLRVTVSVQGARVRTVMDHIYYNPHGRTLEGTFKYTLPPESSISYYAMFVGQQRRTPRFFSGKAPSHRVLANMTPQAVAKTTAKKEWGNLREARLVAAEKGREVYEEITRRRIDPALIEQDAPNTFTGKVFPIPAKGYNRVIIAYEQSLPFIGSEQVYRFRFPDGVADSVDFTIDYNERLSTLSRHNLRKIRCLAKEKQQLLRCYWEQNKPDRDAVFYFRPKLSDVSWAAGLDPIQNRRYLYAQLRVNLAAKKALSSAEQAIFMLDTSLSENPDHFGANVALLKKILSKNPSIKRFNVLFFDVGAIWGNQKGWIQNTPEKRKQLFAKIDALLLEGATDLSLAFRALAAPSWLKKPRQDVDVFFLSDAQVSWGERSLDTMLSRFHRDQKWGRIRFFAYQTGISSENVELLRRLTRSGGSVFQCMGRSELDRCATAHTKRAMILKRVKIEGLKAQDILIAGRQANLFPGSLLTIASRYQSDGNAKIVLEGDYFGQAIQLSYSIPVKAEGDLAPRAWAELAVQQLMELDDPSQTDLIVAYSQHFLIPNQHCSFLILETDKEYKQYGLEQEQKKLRVGDLALFLTSALAEKGAPRSPKDRWIELMRKGMKRSKMLRKSSGRAVLQILANLPDASFVFRFPEARRLWRRGDVSSLYLKKRETVRREFDPFISEAKRRLKQKSVSGAVRSLSSIVELHPSDARALRLVGYYMLGWARPAEAARVFLRVLERRSYEPHSYRDLARAMVKMERYALAASLYEIILASSWHDRFGMIKKIVREEYALLMQQALSVTLENRTVKRLLRNRKMLLGLRVPRSRLRVTLTWNTDNTDIDLWVIEPTGEKCYYSNPKTRNSGRLLEDITRRLWS